MVMLHEASWRHGLWKHGIGYAGICVANATFAACVSRMRHFVALLYPSAAKFAVLTYKCRKIYRTCHDSFATAIREHGHACMVMLGFMVMLHEASWRHGSWKHGRGSRGILAGIRVANAAFAACVLQMRHFVVDLYPSAAKVAGLVNKCRKIYRTCHHLQPP